jgi:hypothetical protein
VLARVGKGRQRLTERKLEAFLSYAVNHATSDRITESGKLMPPDVKGTPVLSFTLVAPEVVLESSW